MGGIERASRFIGESRLPRAPGTMPTGISACLRAHVAKSEARQRSGPAAMAFTFLTPEVHLWAGVPKAWKGQCHVVSHHQVAIRSS